MPALSLVQGVGESSKFADHGYFSRILKSSREAGESKICCSKRMSSNYAHAKFWSEWIKLKAIFGLFMSNSVVYLASEVFTLAFI